MEKNRAQKICKICYIVILTLTFLLACLYVGLVLQSGQDPDGKYVAYVGFGFLILGLPVVMLHELLFYISIRYFLADRAHKTWKKTLLFVTLFLLNLFFVVKEFLYLWN